MPATNIHGYSNNSTDGIRYIYYGSYKKTDVVNGKVHLNQAHKNSNGIKNRNQCISNIDCPNDYKGAVHTFNFYNKQKPNRKVQAVSITISFSKKDFDFRNPEDVYRAVKISRRFVKKAFPNRSAIVAAQFDNERATPHVHCYISAFNEDNLRAFSSQQKNIWHLRDIADKIVHKYNLHNPDHQITEMKEYQQQSNHHQRKPTVEEIDVLSRLKKALKLDPTSQNSFRRACRKYDLRASFKRGRRRSGGRRKRGRRRSRRGLVFKSAKSNGYIKASQLQYFKEYCLGVQNLHNYRGRKQLFSHNWKNYQDNKKSEIKAIAHKMNQANIMSDLYKVGNVDGLDDFKWRAKNQAGVIVSFKNYTKRNGKPGQSIRYQLKGHNHSYSGYQFIKVFGQRGRKFNNYDVQTKIDKNREAIINFEDQNDGSFESTLNIIGTTGTRDLDTQLSVTPPTIQDNKFKSAPKPKQSSDDEPTPTPNTTDTAKKRNAIHSYYQTKEDDRKAIDKFIAKFDNFVKKHTRAVEVAMRKYRKRTSTWLKDHTIKPLKYRYIQKKIENNKVTTKDIENDPLKATKNFNKSLSPAGKHYLDALMYLEINNQKIFKSNLIRQDRRHSGKSYKPFSKLNTDSKVFVTSLNDPSAGLSDHELIKINHFLENDTIINQLSNHHLCKRFNDPEATTNKPTKSTAKSKTPNKTKKPTKSSGLSAKDRKDIERFKINYPKAIEKSKQNKKLSERSKRSGHERE